MRFFLFALMVLGLIPVAAKTNDALIEQETFSLVNRYRASANLPGLLWDDGIAREARAHSREMATGKVDFGHEGFRERVDRLRERLPGLHGAGENVLMTDDSSDLAHQAVAHWLQSPPHLHNIRGEYNRTGVGMWVGSEGRIYFTQIFVRVKP